MRPRRGTTYGGVRSADTAGQRTIAHFPEAKVTRSVNEIHNFELVAPDGGVGTVEDCYFDEDRWAIRYLAVDADRWLPGHRLLISPISIGGIDWGKRRLLLWIARDQIRHSPAIDTRQSVSRQHEMDYCDYYGYPYYWDHAALWGPHALPTRPTSEQIAAGHCRSAVNPASRAADRCETRLRRAAELTGCAIRATDGEVGRVEDCLFDDGSWAIEYLVVNAGNWWRGEHVLVAPAWITSITSFEDSVGAVISRRRG